MVESRPQNRIEDGRMVGRYVGSLPERRKMVLQLYAQGFNTEQAAAEMGVSQDGVTSQIREIEGKFPSESISPQGTILKLIYGGVKVGELDYLPSDKPLVPLDSLEQKMLKHIIIEGMGTRHFGNKTGIIGSDMNALIKKILEKRQVRTIYELAAAMGYESRVTQE